MWIATCCIKIYSLSPKSCHFIPSLLHIFNRWNLSIFTKSMQCQNAYQAFRFRFISSFLQCPKTDVIDGRFACVAAIGWTYSFINKYIIYIYVVSLEEFSWFFGISSPSRTWTAWMSGTKLRATCNHASSKVIWGSSKIACGYEGVHKFDTYHGPRHDDCHQHLSYRVASSLKIPYTVTKLCVDERNKSKPLDTWKGRVCAFDQQSKLSTPLVNTVSILAGNSILQRTSIQTACSKQCLPFFLHLGANEFCEFRRRMLRAQVSRPWRDGCVLSLTNRSFPGFLINDILSLKHEDRCGLGIWTSQMIEARCEIAETF